MNPDDVTDRESFLRFVRALAEDRRLAERQEARDPAVAKWGAARGWQNTTIPTFLDAAASYFEGAKWSSGDARPTWRDLAVFLVIGKIYE